MKKILTVAILLFASVLTYACTDKAQAQQKEPEKKEAKSGEVIVMKTKRGILLALNNAASSRSLSTFTL